MFVRASAIGLLCAVTIIGSAIAQDSNAERRISGKSGQDIRIGVFATVQKDCKAGALPTVKLKQPPSNGSVVVKEGKVRATNLKHCLAIEVPAFIAFYKSKPDFVGEDEVQLEVTDASGRARIHSVRIFISQNPSSQPPPGKRFPRNEPI